MREFIASLSLLDVALIAGATVAISGLILALLSPTGRDKISTLGLRVADALVALLERLLSDPALITRLDDRIDRAVDQTLEIDGAFAAAMAEDVPPPGVITAAGLTEADLDAVLVKFRAALRDAETEIFKDVLWAALTEHADA